MTRLIVIVGPTGAGKTQLALELAERVGGEVVSCDSQQVYRGMDIGTGKASLADRARVRHHLIDVVRPDQEMTAARFVALADDAIAAAAARGAPVVLCGGTGLYVRALLLGLFEGPPADPAVRAELDAAARELGLAGLWSRLREVDPEIAARIDPNDQKRIVRALEVHRLTGIPMSIHQRQHDHRRVPPRYPHRWIGLSPSRAALYRRIEVRVDAMIAAGLVDEVQSLRAAGYRPPLRSQQAIGYAEIHDYLDQRSDLPSSIDRIKLNSRRYARRQLSWYRSNPDILWAEGVEAVDQNPLAQYLTDPS